jgi:hypothetical protein
MFRRSLIGFFLLVAPAAALAADVVVINQTGSAISSLSIRPFGGSVWQPVEGALSVGARRSVSAEGKTCAFDIRAKLAGGGEATWSGVNFCETKAVTLNRRPDGTTWADYD